MNKVCTEKLAQAAELLRNENIDMWLIYSSEGSDPAVSLMTALKTVGKTFFFLTKEGKRYALCSLIDAQESEDSGLFDEVIKYSQDLSERFTEIMNRINPNSIAINYSIEDNLCDGLTAGRYRYLMKILGENYSSKTVSSEKMLQRVRSIKTPEEIAVIEEAVAITQDIFTEVFAQLKIGMTEFEVGELFLKGMSSRGVSEANSRSLEMPIVMKEKIAHRAPGNAVIEKGDFLIMDFGIYHKGYCSDISRTVYFLKDGETTAPATLEYMFKSAHMAITKASEFIKPGVQGYEVDKVARDYLISQGMPEITHAVGHQVGQHQHDGGTILAPRWERYGKAPYGLVEENMVFTLEPTVLEHEGYSVLCEEDIVVTKNGMRFLSKRQDELILIG